MDIIHALNDGILKLTLNGRLDTFGAGPVQQVLDTYFNKRPKFIILDMAGVDFISSAGIRVLLITAKEAEGRQGVLALAGVNPYCRELIASAHITGMLAQFNRPDQAEAFCRAKIPPAA